MEGQGAALLPCLGIYFWTRTCIARSRAGGPQVTGPAAKGQGCPCAVIAAAPHNISLGQDPPAGSCLSACWSQSHRHLLQKG